MSPERHQLQVGYRLAAPDAVARLREAAVRLRTQPVLVADLAAIGSQDLFALASLVLDLSPWNSGAVRTIEGVRRRAPRLPVVVYHPDTGAGMEVAADAAMLPCVICKVQVADAREPERLRSLLAPLVNRYPALRFRQVLTSLFSAAPVGPGEAFLEEAVSRVTAGWVRRPEVAELAAAVGCSRRHLERCLVQAGLPAPPH